MPLGDEAATNGQGAGVITHVITGKTYFIAWSMDVKFEGANVDRHTDLTTSNHASPMANANVPMGNIGTMAGGGGGDPPSAECVEASGTIERVLQGRPSATPGGKDYKAIGK